MPTLIEEITADIEGLDYADPEVLWKLRDLTACLARSVKDLAEEVERGPNVRPVFSDAAAFATWDALDERKRKLGRSKGRRGDGVATDEALDQLTAAIPCRLREGFGLDPERAASLKSRAPTDPLPPGFPGSLATVEAPTSDKSGAE